MNARPLRRLRVLQVLPALDHGGAENVAEALATGVDPARFEMLVCCTRGLGPIAERISAGGIRVELAGPRERPNPYAALWHLNGAVRRMAPDVIHTHGITSLCDVGTIDMVRRVPQWIHTFHYGNYPYKLRSHMMLERLMARRPERLVAVADAQRRAIIELHGTPPARIVTILNGVRGNVFAATPGHRERKRTELGVGFDTFLVGAVAVLSEQKGITHLLDAVRLVVRRRTDVRVIIAGGGPLEGLLRQQASALGLDRQVTFLGWRNDVPEILPALDAWVMSSLWEAMPLALLEAMAARLPIVVTGVSDNAQIVGEGEAGILVPPGAAAPLADAIDRLAGDPDLRARLAATAFERYSRLYSQSHMSMRYQELYEGLVRQP